MTEWLCRSLLTSVYILDVSKVINTFKTVEIKTFISLVHANSIYYLWY